MLQYVLTGIVGVILGVVAMRVWQGREPGQDSAAGAPAEDTASPDKAKGEGQPALGSRNLLIGAGMLAVAGAALFAFRSDDGETAQTSTSAAVAGAPGGAKLDDVDTMIKRLEDRLQANPNDGEGFRMLGWSLVMTGHPDKAIEPYRRAIQLLPGNAMVHAGLGEALVGVASGKVTPEAKAAFDKALSLDPQEPRARYFNGLWLYQNGKKKEALDGWIDLANSGPADAPWQPEVQGKIKDTAAELGVDVKGRIKVAAAPQAGVTPPMAGVPAVPAGQAPPSIDAMVDGLAAKLAKDPKNPDGWVMLLRSRMVQNQPDKAKADLVTARKALADDPQGLAKVNEAAKALGVPGA